MIRVIDVHDDSLLTAVATVRESIKMIGSNVLVIIHGYGSSSDSYKKLTEIRNIGRSRVKKKELSLCVSGPDLNDPTIRSYFDVSDLANLNKYMVNSGVTILKK